MQAYRGPLGQRIVVRGRIGDVMRYTQTLTLWDGVARVDCRTTIDEFTGADRLVRLRWPCPVPGALPVSEVGDAVIGRGFGLMHDRGSRERRRHRTASVDAGQPRIRLVRVVVDRARSGSVIDIRAVSVAEVVTPTEADASALARDLMVALARAGVTATCSSADNSRYGDAGRRLQSARHPDRARRPRRKHFHCRGSGCRRPRATPTSSSGSCMPQGPRGCGCRPVAPLAEEWVPGADLRDVRALPVLVVASARPGRCGRCRCRRSRRCRDRRNPRRANRIGAVRVADRRVAQSRGARVRGRLRRHAAYVADAVVHRLAVGDLDRPAAAHRARRVELPAAALDPHLRLRGRLRRRRLAPGRSAIAQRRVLPSAAGRGRRQRKGRRLTAFRLAASRSSRRVRFSWPR